MPGNAENPREKAFPCRRNVLLSALRELPPLNAEEPRQVVPSNVNPIPASDESACTLESVIATPELDRRPSRAPDSKAENAALWNLTRAFSQAPERFFQTLVKTALQLSGADSTGISLLNEETNRFVWPAVAGELSPYLGGGTPAEFGPCGTVLERKAPVLFLHPERYFTYLVEVAPSLEEVLLIPFRVNGKVVGTIWAVLHGTERKFEAEDRRLLEELSAFASSAYQLFLSNGTLEAMLAMQPQGSA